MLVVMVVVCLFPWRYNPLWLYFSTDRYRALPSSFSMFLDHTQWRATIGRTPLDEWSNHHRGLYLTIHNTHNRQSSMPPVGCEPKISAGERPKTNALDRTATGTALLWWWYNCIIFSEISGLQSVSSFYAQKNELILSCFACPPSGNIYRECCTRRT